MGAGGGGRLHGIGGRGGVGCDESVMTSHDGRSMQEGGGG